MLTCSSGAVQEVLEGIRVQVTLQYLWQQTIYTSLHFFTDLLLFSACLANTFKLYTSPLLFSSSIHFVLPAAYMKEE